MRKGFFGICLSLVIAIVLIGVFVPGCDPETKGSIGVHATLCGSPWPQEGSGFVEFTLTPASGSPINGHALGIWAYLIEPGTWTCSHVSGGPAGAYLDSITPSATQSVSAGEITNFTMNFELEQDAWIRFETWTIDGVPIAEWQGGDTYYDGEERCWYAWVAHCNVIDVHYTQYVDGCEGYEVTLNETDELSIHYLEADPIEPPVPEVFEVRVLNDSCAVNKTAEPEGPDAEKLGQVPSYEGGPVKEGEQYVIPFCQNITLDVETSWQLEKCLNYTKSINWLHIGECYDPPCGWCSVFDLLSPKPGVYVFELRSHASVELVDDVDVNPHNNSTGSSTPLKLIVLFPL